ncbi:MAG: PKD domain-containing protein [Candidatus Peregrinibacteria bacterium]
MVDVSRPVDGIVAASGVSPAFPAAVNPPAVPVPSIIPQKAGTSSVRTVLLLILGVPYALYIFWCFFLLASFPDVTGVRDGLIPLGTLSCAVAAIVLLMIGGVALMRIRDVTEASPVRKKLALIRVVILMLPGLSLSLAVPVAITREPPLTLIVVSPGSAQDFVAPLSVTFSVQDAEAILARRKLIANAVRWDFEGDGKINEETTGTGATAYYGKQGTYVVSATIVLKDGQMRTITRTLSIPQSVFSVEPASPIVDDAAHFSIAGLLPSEELESATWDFGNGDPPVTTQEMDVAHTFYAEGESKVSVTVTMTNKVQQTFSRAISIITSPPQPFPVTFDSSPSHLIGPPPFGALFNITTDEPVRIVLWNFGDGGDARGDRVGHTFTKRGVFTVTAEVRAVSGKVAMISKVVRIAEQLQLPDLTFSGNPDVKGGKIIGEVPVMIDLKPRTSMPLIDFQWEAPEATTVGSLKDSVQAVYRKEGTYTLTLLAQDPDGKVLRNPITVEVLPLSSQVAILMDPDGGTAPLSVRFDASETVIPNETISGFEWKFSDEKDSTAHQEGANVTHVFKKQGTYDIGVKVLTTSGKEFYASKTIVVRAPSLDACIGASRTEGKAPLGIQFTSDCSTATDAAIYSWDFGDGWTSDAKAPTHDFQKPGTYTVILTLKDGTASAVSDPLSITVQP